jgi:lysophospholipase L1-like esterase
VKNAALRISPVLLAIPCVALAAPAFHFERTSNRLVLQGASGSVHHKLQQLEHSSTLWLDVPPGNYKVTLTFDGRSSVRTTVKAETRRLMVLGASGDSLRSFIVNVRTPTLTPPPANATGASAVRLNPAELSSLYWDDGLTLEFIEGDRAIRALDIQPADVPTIYLAGDSTVTDQAEETNASWGQMLPRFVAETAAVANHARSGATLKSFLTELRLDKILESLRAGDWLLIQFGHNDQKTQWPQTYVDAATTYRSYLRAYIAEARRRGATPILITSPERRNFDAAGHIVNSHGDYPDAVRAIAKDEAVALVDLHAMSKTFYEALGPQRAPLAFAQHGEDRTHHNNYGAYELARMVVLGLRNADPKLTANIAKHLIDKSGFNPARPDDPLRLSIPASSRVGAKESVGAGSRDAFPTEMTPVASIDRRDLTVQSLPGNSSWTNMHFE